MRGFERTRQWYIDDSVKPNLTRDDVPPPVLGATLLDVPKATPSRRFTKALATFGSISDPLVRLAAVRAAREDLEALEVQTVREARAAGATWSDIGALFGVSKQAAQQRFRQSR